MRTMCDLEFDVMLEAKAKDLALLRLRQDLVRYAPDVAARLGLHAGAIKVGSPDEVVLDMAELEAAV